MKVCTKRKYIKKDNNKEKDPPQKWHWLMKEEGWRQLPGVPPAERLTSAGQPTPSVHQCTGLMYRVAICRVAICSVVTCSVVTCSVVTCSVVICTCMAVIYSVSCAVQCSAVQCSAVSTSVSILPLSMVDLRKVTEATMENWQLVGLEDTSLGGGSLQLM